MRTSEAYRNLLNYCTDAVVTVADDAATGRRHRRHRLTPRPFKRVSVCARFFRITAASFATSFAFVSVGSVNVHRTLLVGRFFASIRGLRCGVCCQKHIHCARAHNSLRRSVASSRIAERETHSSVNNVSRVNYAHGDFTRARSRVCVCVCVCLQTNTGTHWYTNTHPRNSG